MNEVAKLVRTEEILRLLLAKYTLKEIAAQMTLSYATVLKYVNEEKFRAELRGLSADIYESVDLELKAQRLNPVKAMEALSDKALKNLEELLDSKNESIKMKATQDVLDRDNRFSKTKRIETEQTHKFINPLVLATAARTAREVDTFNSDKSSITPALPGPEVPASGAAQVITQEAPNDPA